MASEAWTAVASMAGVLVGGGLTFLTQRMVHRSAERIRAEDLAEARRAEQIRVLTEFIRFAHATEGVAHARPAAWVLGDDWYQTARPAMDGLRIAEQSVELLCPKELIAPAIRYEHALNEAVWQDRDTPLGDRLTPVKTEFLTAARESLGLD
ncbi:hypothetical protein [Actinophytocola sediminis]